MVVVSGRVRLRASKATDTLRVASEMASTSRKESGCIDYRFAVDVDDSLVVQMLEQWESSEALDAHFGTRHFAAFSEVLLAAVDGPAQFTRFEIASSGPLFG